MKRLLVSVVSVLILFGMWYALTEFFGWSFWPAALFASMSAAVFGAVASTVWTKESEGHVPSHKNSGSDA
jgi:putative flippase GtrA